MPETTEQRRKATYGFPLRLSAEEIALLDRLHEQTGESRQRIIVRLIREEAARRQGQEESHA